MERAVIYVRVSDARQVKGTSLEMQERVCREWCESRGIVVEHVFVDGGESAKSADRPQFQAMFQFLRRSKSGTISYVIVHKFDRFSRDRDDSLLYRYELKQLKVQIQSATEPTDDTPAGRFLECVLTGSAQFDNENRRDRTSAGMRWRLTSGRWVWRAPTGYLNGDNPSEPSLKPDPLRAPLITKLFELMASGEHTKATALAHVTALGLKSMAGYPLTQETIRKILTNHVYCGKIVEKMGINAKGDWELLISEETFERVQMVLAGRAPKPVPHIRERDDFPLRGLILCPVCDKPVTASKSKGKSGKKFAYYRCHRVKGHMNVPAPLIEDAFIDLMNRITPKPERLALIEAIFRNSWRERVATAVAESSAIKTELKAEQARKQRILNQLADGVLTSEEFSQINGKITNSILDLEDRLNVAESNELDVDSATEYLLHLLWNTAIVWQTASFSEKTSIQRRLFPQGLHWVQNGFGTPVTHSIYYLLCDDSTPDGELVAPQGFIGIETVQDAVN